MRVKIISAITALFMSVTVLGAALTSDKGFDTGSPSQTVKNDSGITDGNSSSTALNVVKYAGKLSQEQVMSQIKAQYLVENGGYKDTDEVVVMVSVDGDSLIDTFNSGETTSKTVAEYAESFSGKAQAAKIADSQEKVISRLAAKGLISETVYTYYTVLNAVAVRTTYGNLEEIEKTAGVKSAALTDTYNKIETKAVEVPLNEVDIDGNTGIYNNSSKYTGLGTVTAVLDSGFDMSHRVFERNYDGKEDKLVITETSLNSTTLNVKGVDGGKVDISTFNAGKTTSGLKVKDVYFSEKIPYSYDYADKDPDVFPYDSEHGTHVAGIIAGSDEVIKGIAPDTQLVLMKVFPDHDSGGKTEDIIAALEDAVKLGVDAINMSLGSSCGFARECDDDPEKPNVAKVYDAINDSGISLITAASNSYSAGFGGEQGNTNFVTNPDSGTVGSPSTYDAALSVASISGELSRYMTTAGGKMFFYNESNDLQKVESNKFYEELVDYLKDTDYAIKDGEDNTFEYVYIPGIGAEESYIDFEIDYKSKHPGEAFDAAAKKKVLAGKIVLVERGSNSFEDKAHIAASYGAIACIIFNNIDGDITMSMGNTFHIPTISVSKDDGNDLMIEARENGGKGTLVINSKNMAGPFMSDFSSWGPTPSLGLKPEITAHGGNIMSAIPGRDGDEYRYGKLSGTSMATPNLCGIVVLIRQYLKDKYGSQLTAKEIKDLTNQLMMSTAGIAINEEGNPYSPRKQGAGLADIGRTTTTNGYVSVDGKDRSKLELGDDAGRTGVYVMEFNVVNMSKSALTYDVSIVGMTESVSTSDSKHVAETPYILSNGIKVEVISGGSVSGTAITVNGNTTDDATKWNKAKVKVTYTLTDADKQYIDSHFENGMYVEGFVKLAAHSNEVSLNVPFLAFYGDWTEAPMFDKTYYEVESTAHDKEATEDDKIKADYYATTPYGKYFYNYMIPLGTYLYDIDESKYSEIPATEDKIAISDSLGSIDGISVVLAGLLRGAKHMNFSVTDKATGEVLWEYVDHNALKSFSQGGSPLPYYDYLKLNSSKLGLINNREYEFVMKGELDLESMPNYVEGRTSNNKRDSYSFDFTLDNEAPIIKDVSYRKEYDTVAKKDRYYIDMVVYDNQYAMSVTPIIFTSSSSYTFLSENPIPITDSVKGGDSKVSFEITDYLDDILTDALIPSAFAFSVDDYALNSNIFICQLPGTRGDFKFTRTGEKDSSELLILPVNEGELVDLTQYLYTADVTVGENREYVEYLKHLVWTSSNEDIVEVEQGLLKVKKAGRATVTVTEKWDGKQAVIIINAKKSSDGGAAVSVQAANGGESLSDKLQDIRFSHFKTTFAYSRAAQTSEIGATGDVNYVNATNGTISMYPGEKIKLYEQIKPWYVAEYYELTYTSGNNDKVTVDKDGNVTAIAEGTSTIYLAAKDTRDGVVSKIQASVTINVKNPFVIENRTLTAYKGIGDENGVVEIPDDEGILYIDSFAFCLYTTDRNVELDDDDYDSNKIPSSNEKIKKVIIPEGVEEIRKYAFYNCSSLEEVVLPSTVKYIREYSFSLDKNLVKIGKNDGNGNAAEGQLPTETIVIGTQAFNECGKLKKINLSNVYAIGDRAFRNCVSLEEVDLKNLRNTETNAFVNCTALKTVKMNANTKLGAAMFAGSGIETVDIYEKTEIPAYLFANCYKLRSVTLHNSVLSVGLGAFSRCVSLTEFKYDAGVTVSRFENQAFYNATGLESFTLPDGETSLGSYCFLMDPTDATLAANVKAGTVTSDKINSKLTMLVIGANAKITSIDGEAFKGTKLARFVVNAGNTLYKASDDGKLLMSKDGKKIYLAANSADFGEYEVGEGVTEIASGAFSGTNITKLIVRNPDTVIGDYAFEYCDVLKEVIFPVDNNITISDYAFANTGIAAKADKTEIVGLAIANLEYVKSIGEYAFANSGIKEATITLKNGTTVGEGAFFKSYIAEVTIKVGEGGGKIGLGAFQSCGALSAVNFVKEGNGTIELGASVFANSTELSKIEFDNVIKEIPIQTFYNCSKLASVKLYGVEEIGNAAFANCGNLSEVLFTKDGEQGTLVTIGDAAFAAYENDKNAKFTQLNLPDSLKNIGEGAFLLSGLREISIPDGVTFPSNDDTKDGDEAEKTHFNGNYVFYGCAKLEAVKLGKGVTKVGKYMFGACDSLKKINLGKVEYIGDYAFTQTIASKRDDGGSKLANIDLSSVKKIGEAAFMNCTAISGKITAPNLTEIGAFAFRYTNFSEFLAAKLEKIGNNAFEGVANKSFTEFVVTENLKSVGEAAFYGCKYLQRFVAANATTYVEKVELGNAVIYQNSLYMKLKNGKWQLASVPSDLRVPYGNNQLAITAQLNVMDGTYRIDTYAGSENPNIQVIVLPESLEYIGNYAFYGYGGNSKEKELTVHFNSYKAPVLENTYNSNISLDEKAAKYGLLHAFPDIFQTELCYCNFVDVAGNFESIDMVVPSNETLEGYDSLVYEAYFGKLENAIRNGNIVMDKYTKAFFEYAEKVAAIGVDNLKLSDESTVNEAITAMNATKQKEFCSQFGEGVEEKWDAYETLLTEARAKIKALKLDASTAEVKQIESDILSLPERFDMGSLEKLKELTKKINELDPEDRSVLSTAIFNKFSASFTEYVKETEKEAEAISQATGFKFKEKTETASQADTNAPFAALPLLGVAFAVIKRKFF